MKNIFTTHLQEQNETYFQHMLGAWKVCILLEILLFKSDDNDLYETFGGD